MSIINEQLKITTSREILKCLHVFMFFANNIYFRKCRTIIERLAPLNCSDNRATRGLLLLFIRVFNYVMLCNTIYHKYIWQNNATRLLSILSISHIHYISKLLFSPPQNGVKCYIVAKKFTCTFKCA